MKIEIDVPDQLVIATINRGVCHWIRDFFMTKNAQDDGAAAHALRGGKVVIIHDNTSSRRKRNMRTPLNRECIERGLVVFATKYPHHYSDMMSPGGGDAATGNYLTQCCLFGEVMFE